MNLETKITIYKFTPQLFTLTPFNKNSPLFVRQILSFIKKDAKCIISIFHLFH